MCLNPKWIYKKGNRKKTNYKGIEGEPYEVGTYSQCGYCTQCLNLKANNWVIRNYYESKLWKKIAFITLTYKNSPKFIIKKDGQDFMKRLRRKIEYEFEKKYKAIKGTALYKELKKEFKEENAIRMFTAYEYGDLNGRPHIHIILYNFEDIEKKYLDINKRGNILYVSKLIQETWGLGRTSIQTVENLAQLEYLSLYETPKESFKKAYKMNMDKIKIFKENSRRVIPNQKYRKHWLKALQGFEKTLKKSKEKYLLIKESNTWSTALGWESFYDEYAKEQIHDFKVYIEGKEYVTPTPWLKKLANMGDIDAKNELLRREEQLRKTAENEKMEVAKNQSKLFGRRKKEIFEYNDKKTVDEDL